MPSEVMEDDLNQEAMQSLTEIHITLKRSHCMTSPQLGQTCTTMPVNKTNFNETNYRTIYNEEQNIRHSEQSIFACVSISGKAKRKLWGYLKQSIPARISINQLKLVQVIEPSSRNIKYQERLPILLSELTWAS